MNIDGLGESLIAQLIENGLVRDYADRNALTEEQLANLTGHVRPVGWPGNSASIRREERREGDRQSRTESGRMSYGG
jgi:NAD-dependent DNA ligase